MVKLKSVAVSYIIKKIWAAGSLYRKRKVRKESGIIYG